MYQLLAGQQKQDRQYQYFPDNMKQEEPFEFLCQKPNVKLLRLKITEQESLMHCTIGQSIEGRTSIREFCQLLNQQCGNINNRLLELELGQSKNIKDSQQFSKCQKDKNEIQTESKYMQPQYSINDNSQSSIFDVKQAQYSQEIYVKKWVDYSSKGGLGYLLSNGITGVLFNDSTNIILDIKLPRFYYMDLKGKNRFQMSKSHFLNNYPIELQKKVSLAEQLQGFFKKVTSRQDQLLSEERCEQIVYMKKWMKKKDIEAIMFRLSNRIVQINYRDSTKVIISAKHKIVTYISDQGAINHYSLLTIFDGQNSELREKLKYLSERYNIYQEIYQIVPSLLRKITTMETEKLTSLLALKAVYLEYYPC